jgi:nucleoside recognition membrane protein YjiH
MKNILVILITLAAFNLTSQVDSTVNKRIMGLETQILQMKNNTEAIQMNLEKCHKLWSTGLIMNFAGIAISAGGLASINTSNIQSSDFGLPIAGGVMSLIGTIVMINAHKYIGKAGLGLSANGIRYRFKSTQPKKESLVTRMLSYSDEELVAAQNNNGWHQCNKKQK